MKIAIYGVSRSGKNYLIKKLIKQIGKKAYHLEGSVNLNYLALNKYKCQFKELKEAEKDFLRKEFTKLIHQKELLYEYVFVDAHFAFIDKENYKIVFTSEDQNVYDTFFYLDTSSEKIIEFSRKSEGEKKNTLITKEDIDKWKQFEINSLSKICKKANKDFTILNQNVNNLIDYIIRYLVDKSIKNKEVDNKNRLISRINEIANKSKNKLIVLLDADGTIIPYDSADIMAKYLNKIDTGNLKPIFQKYDDYCFSAFYDIAKYYSKYNSQDDFIMASQKASNDIKIREEFIELMKLNNVDFIITTAGFSILWQKIIEKYNFNNVYLIAGNNLYDDCIIGQAEKGIVAKILKKKNKTIACFGDALVDKDMFLNSDYGFLIVNKRVRSIVKHIEKNKKFKYIPFGDTFIPSMEQTTFSQVIKQLKQIN